MQQEQELSEEEIQEKKHKAEAAEERLKGNSAYKARRFEEALEHYNKAFELNDEDISSVTNRQGDSC